MIPFRDNIPSRLPPVVTVGIIVLNVLAFLYELRLPEDQLELFFYRYGFVPARVVQLVDGKEVTAPIVHAADRAISIQPSLRGTLLSLLTMMFLHGGWLHLIGNMWYLWIFGDNIEDRLGHVRFLILYGVGGIAATASQFVMTAWFAPGGMETPTLGASGAVAAVLGAYLITFPHARILTLVPIVFFITLIELPALIVLGFWFVVQLLTGTASLGAPFAAEQGGVAWWAHIGGFVAGILLMRVLSPKTSQHGYAAE